MSALHKRKCWTSSSRSLCLSISVVLLHIFSHTGSRIRIRIASKNLGILTKKIVSKLSEILSNMFIRVPDLDFYPSRTPDPGVKKARDPGSAILVFTKFFWRRWSPQTRRPAREPPPPPSPALSRCAMSCRTGTSSWTRAAGSITTTPAPTRRAGNPRATGKRVV